MFRYHATSNGDVPFTSDEEVEADTRDAAYLASKLVKTYSPLTAWQVRKVLTQTGLRKQVEDALLVADQNTQDAWNYATSFRRDDAILKGMAVKIGITDEQVDEMFTVGAAL